MKKLFNDFICFMNKHDFCVIINETGVSLKSLDDKRIIATDYWIFCLPWVLKSSIILFKYGLVLRRYFSINRALFSVTLAFMLNVIVTKFVTNR